MAGYRSETFMRGLLRETVLLFSLATAFGLLSVASLLIVVVSLLDFCNGREGLIPFGTCCAVMAVFVYATLFCRGRARRLAALSRGLWETRLTDTVWFTRGGRRGTVCGVGGFGSTLFLRFEDGTSGRFQRVHLRAAAADAPTFSAAAIWRGDRRAVLSIGAAVCGPLWLLTFGLGFGSATAASEVLKAILLPFAYLLPVVLITYLSGVAILVADTEDGLSWWYAGERFLLPDGREGVVLAVAHLDYGLDSVLTARVRLADGKEEVLPLFELAPRYFCFLLFLRHAFRFASASYRTIQDMLPSPGDPA